MLEFWNSFGSDWRANCLAWEHLGVMIAPSEGWQARWTANPDLLGDDLYYRGSGTLPDRPDELKDRLGVARIVSVGRDGLVLDAARMIVDTGREGEFDASDVLDPATVEFQGRVLLYYSGIGASEDAVGLAISDDDGETFRKVGQVLVGRAPEVVVVDGRVMMLAQRLDGETYRLFLYESEDGETFRQVVEEPVFAPEEGAWDAKSVVTFRHIGEEDGWHYLLYGGSADHADEPDFFGLIRSRDLSHWERHPGNPIFGLGRRGEPDGGAIWFPAVWEAHDGWLMLYEGSEGRYSWSLHSQICGAFRVR
ncbi:hypothetical protein BH11ARM2_BH11ARM2_14410 [soil metagenome]